MKTLHRPDLFSWSRFDESRDVDFHGTVWAAHGGVAIDPLPLSDHDRAHVEKLGGIAWVVVTSSDHTRATQDVAARFGAKVAGPRAEAATFPFACDRWLGDGDEVVPGLRVLELHGSKTPGELALLLEETTLVTGDLVRCHAGGRLHALPPAKLADAAAALASIRRLAELPGVEAVLVGDGWPTFKAGRDALRDLVRTLEGGPKP